MHYFTIGDFILVIPMALAGALFLGALPSVISFWSFRWRWPERCSLARCHR